jgi:phage tail-like protein
MPKNDPLRNFRFRVEIDNTQVAGFSEVHTGASVTEVVEYREGTDPARIRKLPGLTRYGNITLKAGVTHSLELYNWRKQVIAGDIASARRQVAIIVQDEGGTDQARWVVREAWPSVYDASDLNAKGNEVLIELLELVNEGIERVS